MDELLDINDRAWEQFRKLPNVHAVGIGKKVTRGVRTDEIVLTVYVTTKLPLDALTPDTAIPPTFEGVRTDVVQRPLPRTLQGTPITITEAVVPAGKRFSFTSAADPDPPPRGIALVLTVTVRRGANNFVFTSNTRTNGEDSLHNVISRLELSNNFLVASVDSNTDTVTVTVADALNDSLDATCYTLLIDETIYTPDFLRGGIRIQGGAIESGGTLGCLATLLPTPVHPDTRIVGITCAHVVRSLPVTERSALQASVKDNRIELEAKINPPFPTRPIQSHLVISAVFERVLGGGLQGSAFYTTSKDEPLASIASGLAKAISDAGIPGVSATVETVMLMRARVIVHGFSAANELIHCKVESADALFPAGLKIKAGVEKDASGDHFVSFSSTVSSDTVSSRRVGVFLDIDRGGSDETFGVYHNPRRNQKLEAVAQSLCDAINGITPNQRAPVSASPEGAKVKIVGAKDVRVWLHPDMRVGHPSNFFATPHPYWCGFRIGRVLQVDARLDVALVQLDAGLKYKHHIQEINAVVGAQAPSIDLPVQKRGFVSGVTHGTVTAVGLSGLIAKGNLLRMYRNAAEIESTVLDPTGKTTHMFSLPGDSGSAVVTSGPGQPKVVGILFSGWPDGTNALITPINKIIEGFAALNLTMEPAASVDLDAVHTVPAPTVNLQAAADDDPLMRSSAGAPLAALGERLSEVETQVAATPVGREYAAMVRRHLTEALELINRNRRVATVWHRSGGLELLNAILRVLRFDDEPLPREINGRPITECIQRLRAIFMRYGSPQLSHDIDRLAVLLTGLPGMTYPQVIATLHTESGSRDVK